MKESILFTTDEAAAYLGTQGVKLSATWLRQMRARNGHTAGVKGPAFVRDKHGRVFYSASALERYIRARKGL